MVAMGAVAIANENVDTMNTMDTMERGGVRGEDTKEELLLLQPLVKGGGMRVAAAAVPKPRLASLDVFRGLSIAVMILVDRAGGIWPSINHSPWNGITLADFVMPFFLFIVGVALALTYKRIASDKKLASRKALRQTLKLLIVGLIVQGGYYHGLRSTAFGVDLERIRLCGVLQRIALAYLVVALCEIWAPRKQHDDLSDKLALFKIYYIHWIVAAVIVAVYLALLYGVYVPDWEFIPMNSSTTSLNPEVLRVICGVRGDVGPSCNVVGYLDRTFIGFSHMYQKSVYGRTPECSVNSPDYGPRPVGAPDWCLAPFDPEGILSSVSAIGSCFLGLHFGHVLNHRKEHAARLHDWSVMSLALLITGLFLHLIGMPFNKPLYSVSYMLFTGGAAGIVLAGFYFLVDVRGWRSFTFILEWMGQNAMLMYILVAEGVIVAVVQGIYIGSPENNLITWIVRQVEHGAKA